MIIIILTKQIFPCIVIPILFPLAFYCRQPPPITNGHYVMSSNTTVYGTVTKYYCNEGFTMKGKDTITCVASGYWDSEPPVCIGNHAIYETIV